MPFTRKLDTVPFSDRDEVGGHGVGQLLGEFAKDPRARAHFLYLGWNGTDPFTYSNNTNDLDADNIWLSTHVGDGGDRSQMVTLGRKLEKWKLIGQAEPATPSTGEPPSGPTPTPGPAPAPVGRKGAFDELEVEVGKWGLGESGKAAVQNKLNGLRGAFDVACKKIQQKMDGGAPWEVAVNCGRLSDLFGTTSRYTQHQLQTTGLSADDWKAALGEPGSGGSGPGFGIQGQSS